MSVAGPGGERDRPQRTRLGDEGMTGYASLECLALVSDCTHPPTDGFSRIAVVGPALLRFDPRIRQGWAAAAYRLTAWLTRHGHHGQLRILVLICIFLLTT
jgi:hypothetical protein